MAEQISGESFGCSYLCDGILARTIDNIVERTLAAHIVDADELQQRCVDEAHADAVPHVHCGQIGHHRQCAPKTVRSCEEIEHGSDACVGCMDEKCGG